MKENEGLKIAAALMPSLGPLLVVVATTPSLLDGTLCF